MLTTSQSPRPRIACYQCSKAKTGCDKKEPRCSRCHEKNLDCELRYARRTPRVNLVQRRQILHPHRQHYASCNLPAAPGITVSRLSSPASLFTQAGQLHGWMSLWDGARQLTLQSCDFGSSVPQPNGLISLNYDGFFDNASVTDGLNRGQQATPAHYYGSFPLPDTQGSCSESSYSTSHLANSNNERAFLPFSYDPLLPNNEMSPDDGSVSSTTPSDGLEARQDVNFTSDLLYNS